MIYYIAMPGDLCCRIIPLPFILPIGISLDACNPNPRCFSVRSSVITIQTVELSWILLFHRKKGIAHSLQKSLLPVLLLVEKYYGYVLGERSMPKKVRSWGISDSRISKLCSSDKKGHRDSGQNPQHLGVWIIICYDRRDKTLHRPENSEELLKAVNFQKDYYRDM